ncbi:MAG: archease [Desulfobacterota bacterium]|nr:archease [Thermodesulfobacteriota bacterium]MDW8002024.1 archease [Deltaproteobacteria bacterium]
MVRFSLFDHEADIGIEIYGSSQEEIFKNAAYALFSIMVEGSEQKGYEVTKSIILEKNGELLISFLNELLYLWETERIIIGDLEVELEDNRLRATLFCRRFDPQIHTLKKEIKAATYHNFELKRLDEGYIARVILDV